MKPVFCLLIFAFLAILCPSSAFAQSNWWCWNSDQVHAFLQDDLVTVVHESALYNCCLRPFTYEVEQEGSLLRVREIENLEAPCDCMCCYDLSVTLGALGAGEHIIEFWWNDYERGGWVVEIVPIHIPDGNEPGRVDLVDRYASDCLETQDLPEPELPPEESTWGRLKSLFD